jgi:DNA-directed RNA polymerase subunit RPC12/RpoP
MRKVKCKKCNYEWNYKGKNPYYVTCPHCYTKVNVQVKK